MLKEVKKIRIQGANFSGLTKLSLFCDDNNPVKSVLLYGRNGSGKSTIARAFKMIRGLPTTNVQSASVTDDRDALITLTDEEKNHICVFDEDFVTKNVRLQEDGLGSIVMLGEQVGLAEQITSAMEELRIAENDRDQKKAVVDEYNDATNPKSPRHYVNMMYSVLQQDNGWAGRKRKIEELRRNASVTDNTYKDFIHLTPEKTRDELIVEFEQEWDKLEKAKSGASIIAVSVPTIPQSFGSYEVESGNALLQQVIEHPELTDREQYLLNLVQTGHGEQLRITAHEFDSPELGICPKCHQPLSEEYKHNLITSIQKVLSEEVKDHQNKLQQLLLPTMELDLSPFQNLPSYQSCDEQMSYINQILLQNNGLLQAKINEPYTPVVEQLKEITGILSAFVEYLEQLENERITHNRTITDTHPIKAELNRINNEIAYWDVIELSRQYDIKMTEKEYAERTHTIACDVWTDKQNRLNALNAQRDSIDIAIDVINAALKYIFFSENRLQISNEHGTYKLFCNGQPVKPKDISAGERNIIGLCYFFTDILAGKSRETAYSEEYLLVIDDPVSSYDLENRVGILSYLKYQLGQFLLGNTDTKALIMTHDLLTAIDVGKMCSELMNDCNRKFNGQGSFTYSPKELQNNQVVRFNNNRNEYTTLIGLVYEYACGGATDQEPYVGNIIRQVLEAFSTFEYKKGITDISTDDVILSGMEHEEHRLYFKNLMYRLVLNEGSHRYDQTRNMQIDFFTVISEADKRRTAKEILCFMELLNAPHVNAHLGAAAVTNIESWCEEIRNRTVPTL